MLPVTKHSASDAMATGCATDFWWCPLRWPSDRLGLGPVDVIRAPLPKICRTPMATSMNIASDGSGSGRLRGVASTGSPFASRNSRRMATCVASNPNLLRTSTRRYSDRMRSSKQIDTLPANTHRKTVAGTPSVESKLDTMTLVSRTIFNRSSGPCGTLGFPGRSHPWSTGRDRSVLRSAEDCSARPRLGYDGCCGGTSRGTRHPSRSKWRWVCRCWSQSVPVAAPSRPIARMCGHATP